MELKYIINDENIEIKRYEFVYDCMCRFNEVDYWCLIIYDDLEYRLRNYNVTIGYFKSREIELKDVPENVLKVYTDIVSDPLFDIEYRMFKGI